MSSYAFTLKDTAKQAIHLTNNAIQAQDTNMYGKQEDGNQLSLDLASQKCDLDLKKIIKTKIIKMIQCSLQAVESKLNRNNRKYCFEIFGYDFMIDQN